jgi:hypothetical protein
LKSDEEFRSRQSDLPDLVADSLAGQNILVDLRIRERFDVATKLVIAPFETRQRWPSKVRSLHGSYRRSPTGRPGGRHRETTGVSMIRPGPRTRSTRACSRATCVVAIASEFCREGDFESKETGRAKFLLTQISEALAPTNFLFSNPAAVKAAIDSGGKTLLDGY